MRQTIYAPLCMSTIQHQNIKPAKKHAKISFGGCINICVKIYITIDLRNTVITHNDVINIIYYKYMYSNIFLE